MKTTRGTLASLAAFALVPLAGTGCSVSACAGSGCDNGTIQFGTGYSQKSSGGDISLVGKKDTFTVGSDVTMLAHLSENAGTKSLTLRASGGSQTHNVPYSVSSSSNVLATTFHASALRILGIDKPGKYTLSLLRGSKTLAKGDLTEK